MISSVSIGNFKAFADTQTLPIKPITLIFGANSSGKSSIIHSMLLTNEIVTEEKLNLDIHFTKLGGESVDLGGFRQFVNRRDTSKNVLIGIELEIANLSEKLDEIKRLKEIFYSFTKIKVIIEFGFSKIDSLKEEVPCVLSYEVITDEESFFKMSRKESGLGMDFIDSQNIIINNLLEVIITSFTTSEKIDEADENSFNKGLDNSIQYLIADSNRLVPSGIIEISKFNDPRKLPLSPINKENRAEVLQDITINLIPFIINDILLGLSVFTNEEVRKIEYLGPLRSFPERHFNFSKSNDNNWFAGGGHAWEVLIKDQEVRNKVNEWLGSEKLKQKYELKIAELFTGNLIEEVYRIFKESNSFEDVLYFILDGLTKGVYSDKIYNELVNFLEERVSHSTLNLNEHVNEGLNRILSVEEMMDKINNLEDDSKKFLALLNMSRKEILQDLILLDKNSNTQVSHRDVGIGISQVLPVLVSVFANKEKLVAIEQPEIHLHPAFQAELGDLFINSALGESKNSFILETHSEHLILRIMRRIRETTEGTLPKGFVPVKPEDVQIVFIKPSNKGAEIVNLEIDEEGDFKTKWPDGFFEERAEELF